MRFCAKQRWVQAGGRHRPVPGRALFSVALVTVVAHLLLAVWPTMSPAMAEGATGSRHVAIAARLAGDDSRVRLVLDFEREPEFELHYLENPYRAVIDLPETVFAFPQDALQSRGLVSAVRFGNSGNEKARMVFDITIVDPESFSAEVAGSKWPGPDENAVPGQSPAPPGDTLTIVIDAGHGGIDGGAEGPAGSMEKNVTLAFAQALKAALEEQDGIRVAMTRTDDSFLSLSARVRRARDEAADLLISLHADSISVRSLRGATVYTLSDKASDAQAQSLADQENREDAIAGPSLENAPEAIAAILVDLARTETRVFSTGLAQQVINSFEGQVKLIKNPLRHAGFRVLQAPDVPSVLVEMGYLSNREDEKLLNDEEWRKNTAQLLAQSVQNYREMILAGRR